MVLKEFSFDFLWNHWNFLFFVCCKKMLSFEFESLLNAFLAKFRKWCHNCHKFEFFHDYIKFTFKIHQNYIETDLKILFRPPQNLMHHFEGGKGIPRCIKIYQVEDLQYFDTFAKQIEDICREHGVRKVRNVRA